MRNRLLPSGEESELAEAEAGDGRSLLGPNSSESVAHHELAAREEL